MKSQKKPFVVEFKNRRRLSRKETSIWGRVDLKGAGDEFAAEETATEAAAGIDIRLPETPPVQDAAEIGA
ncbi:MULTISPECIES: hypothetical protein [unclassified Shinella]|uniref:hypothetical protein n=1 Tax=unclassified Shinella TaxID=2643062 RepID=UPI00225D2F2B|nr:hypothetical protein [Shinella sp. YE25]MDC7259515.1 hypothetical protein [Shinella sp. YE25]CAI0341288.1 conserved hypothetical protein [Rhizobiaceae bacterium]CAK7260929.1 conserved protein of unknown function [Shinella sp. WSC3-e]